MFWRVPTIQDEAVVLRHWEFSETSQTVSLFTRAHGVVRGLAKGSRRERSNFSGGFELLTRGDLVAIIKPGKDLATLTEWGLIEQFRGASRVLGAYRAAMYLIDLTHHAITDHDPHAALYDELVRGLRELESPDARARSVLRFQWSVLVETGYRPALDRHAASGAELPTGTTLGYSPAAGGVVEDPGTSTPGPPDPPGSPGPTGPWRVRRATIDLLRRLSVDPTSLDRERREDVDRAGKLLSLHLRAILDRDLPTRRGCFAAHGPEARDSA